MPAHDVYLLRHGETEWSLSGRHTGFTDIPLTENGRRVAAQWRPHAATRMFKLVLSSPLRRARETCELAGFGKRAQIDPDLLEWNYGDYEGLTTREIAAKRPDWILFNDGCPGGESPEQVGSRVDRVIGRVRAASGPAALFAHGHVLRVFAARWLDLPTRAASRFLLETTTVSVLSAYHGIPAMKRWNAPLTAQQE